MMNNCIGIINLDENEQKTIELTRRRPLASLPIAGRYRVVDFILSNGKFYVLELNTLPGMTTTSLIPRSANAKGLSYSELVDKIMETSVK